MFDGQINTIVLIDIQHLDLDFLPDCQELVDVADIGIRDVGNMYQAGLAALQGHESAEFCDPGDLAFQDCTHCELHK